MDESDVQRAARAVARLLYGDIGEESPAWESCVEIAETVLRAVDDRR